MRKTDDRLDLTKAFAAPPESFVQRTRVTLDQLEEAEQVKKKAYGAMIAIACALILMATGLAAGFNGALLRDGVTGQPDVLSPGTGGVDMWRENDGGVELTFDRVVFSGEYLYMELTYSFADDGRYRMDYFLDVTVNGAEPELLSGNVTAGGETTQYECIYRCAPAAAASVRIDLGDDKSGRSFNATAEADKDSIARFHIAQDADAAIPELDEGYALTGEGFGVVLLRWTPDTAEEIAWKEAVADMYSVRADGLPNATVGVHRQGDSLLARAMFRGDMPGEFSLRFADDQLAHYELQFREDSTYSPGGVQELYVLEAQRDGRLLHVRAQVNGVSAPLSVTLGGEPLRALAGVTEHFHSGEGDQALTVLHDMLFYCGEEQQGALCATAGELAMTMGVVHEQEGRMQCCSVEYAGEGTVQPVTGWAVNAPGMGVACGAYLSDDEAELHRIIEALRPPEVGGRTPSVGTRLFERDGMHGLEVNVYSAHGMLPEELELGEGLTFRLSGSDRSVVDNYVSWMDAERVGPALNVSDVAYDGKYLMVSHEVSLPGAPLYAGEGIDTEYAGQPVGDADGVQVTTGLTAADGAPLERVYASARYAGEGRDSMVLYELYECAMGDEANAVLSVNVGTHAMEAAVSAPTDDGALSDITGLNVQTIAHGDYVAVHDVRAYALDSDLILRVTYAPADGGVFGEDGVNRATIYGAADSSVTTVNRDEHGEPVSLTYAAVYYGMADAGTVELYVEAPGSGGGEYVLVHTSRPAHMTVLESGTAGGYAYALAEVAREGGGVTYDCAMDYMNAALTGAAEQYEAGGLDAEELSALMEALAQAYIANAEFNTDAEVVALEAIGGADGPTAVTVGEAQPASPPVEDAAIAVIGGADGPTSIYVSGLNPTPAPVAARGTQDDVSIGIIGGADGPTSIYVTGAHEAMKQDYDLNDPMDAVGSSAVDVGYSHADARVHAGTAPVLSPRMLSGGADVTLAVADVSAAFGHEDGAAVLLIVGRAGEDMEVRCALEDAELSAGFECAASDSGDAALTLDYAGAQAGGATVTDALLTPIGDKGMALLEVRYTAQGDHAPFVRRDVLPDAEGARWLTLDADGNVLAAVCYPQRTYYAADGVYHGDYDCAGESKAQLLTAQAALERGLTPCGKCVNAGLPVVYGVEGGMVRVFDMGGGEYRAYQLLTGGMDVSLHVTNGLGVHATLTVISC